MTQIYRLLSTLLLAYELALFAYVLLSWFRPAANRWTELLRSFVEPPLKPIRRFLTRKLPLRWQFIDWSVLAMWLLLDLIRRVLIVICF